MRWKEHRLFADNSGTAKSREGTSGREQVWDQPTFASDKTAEFGDEGSGMDLLSLLSRCSSQ